MKADSSELYYFLRMYSIDLDTALHTIKMLRRYKRPDVQSVMLRDVAISYIRPFSGNNGEHTKSHILQSSMHVPKSMRQLHQELHDLRMKQFAHTDLTYYRPQVRKIRFTPESGFAMAFKGYDYAALLRKLPQIEELIRAVEKSLHAEIAELEKTPHFEILAEKSE